VISSLRILSRRNVSVLALGLAFALFNPLRSGANVPRSMYPSDIPPRVLVIGDSLTVGPFGDKLEEFLIRSVGDSQVYIFASCGSSPEHWLEAEPEFRSRCGFRVKTPRKKTWLGRHENGRPPEVHSAPKVENLLSKIHPDLVIIQLGTNWFDMLAESGSETGRKKIQHLIEQFHTAVQRKAPRAGLVWITPPDSSRFRAVQSVVTDAIRDMAKNRYEVINSSKMIRYEPGKSGGDGVHLAAPAAEQWFEKVRRSLKNYLHL
jgi:hypothetical protein